MVVGLKRDVIFGFNDCFGFRLGYVLVIVLWDFIVCKIIVIEVVLMVFMDFYFYDYFYFIVEWLFMSVM